MWLPLSSDGRHWLAPEVVQTSAMDCGPAALKCLLDGHGIPVSYGRLREACQTDVDGTSIDTLEQVAIQLGLNAEQVMLPADHLLLPDSRSLPALVVVRLPDGMTHFVVVWRLHGNWIQVMDPTSGRRWLRREQFFSHLYLHRQPVAAEDWRTWAGSEEFIEPLMQRLLLLEIDHLLINQLLQQASGDSSWISIAALDAATRMVTAIVRGDGLAKGEEAARVLQTFFQQAKEDLQSGRPSSIPASYWSVQVLPELAQTDEDENASTSEQETLLLLSGAVLIQVLGRSDETQADSDSAPELSAELAAALQETPSRPELEIFNLLKIDGLFAPTVVLFTLLLATFGVMVEALLFRGILELGQGLPLSQYRLPALIALFVFLIIMLLLEYPLRAAENRFGRHIENRLRMRFMEKIPRLHDRYFSSRLTSDMAHRVYELRELRDLPALGVLFLRTNFELLLTTAGLIWINPGGALIALLALLTTVGIWLVSQPKMIEQDLNLRTHEGALSRFYLDALLGLTPIRTHGAEKSVRREHEGLMVQWANASLDFYRTFTFVNALAALLGLAFAVWILFNYLNSGGAISGVLLLFYWTLRLPALGQILAQTLQQYPMQRNRILRLLEPLGAPEENQVINAQESTPGDSDKSSPNKHGVTLRMDKLNVQAGGHPILQDIDLSVKAAEHVAIVGPSGAGKSSLVGLLLGWHRPQSGHIFVDDELLSGAKLQQLRRETAWVDPAVQIWNRSLLDNLRYGNASDDTARMNAIIERADLFRVLERLPDGLQTALGEGGGLVSGGEGQRVRLARAMLRSQPRLVILDEPFRGLDRRQRTDLLARAREHWAQATLLFISHDVGDTQSFDRVLVIENGQIVEDDKPDTLLAQDSRYRRLLEAEREVREGLWASAEWRRLRLVNGKLEENR